jgi:chromosome partitioning protein
VPRSARVVAVANQKGGVAKTTTVVSLGSALAGAGRRVLLVDLDAQACLTFSLGLDPDAIGLSVDDVLRGRPVRDVAVPCQAKSDARSDAGSDAEVGVGADAVIDLVPATIELAGVEAYLLGRAGREFTLRTALEPVLGDYDVVLLDCSPSLGVLTLNALTAATDVLVPLQCEMLSHRGVGQLLDTVADVQRLLNRDLVVRGLLPTMFDGRTMHARAVLADLPERYGVPVLSPPIPKSIRFAEAPALGRSVLATARTSKGAVAYREIAASLLATWTRPGPS